MHFKDSFIVSWDRQTWTGVVLAVWLVGAWSWAGPSSAQSDFDGTKFVDGVLALNGDTRLQQDLGSSIHGICREFTTNAAAPTPDDGSAGGDLFARCQQMVQTATALAGGSGTVPSGPLNLTSEGLNALVQDIAHDDKSSANPTPLQDGSAQVSTNIGKRLASIRGGATGLSIAGLTIEHQGIKYPSTEKNPLLEESAAGADEVPRWGLFANGVFKIGDFDGTSEQAGFDFHSEGFAAGADYRLTDGYSMGLALGYSKEQVDFDRNTSESENQQISVSIYGTLFQSEAWYLDGIVGYTRHLIETDRDIRFPGFRRRASGNTEGDELLLSAGGGYNFNLGGGLEIGPYVKVEYKKLWIESYDESGAIGLNISYDEDTVRSLVTNIGVTGSYSFSTQIGVFTTSVYVDWEREYEDDSRIINARYTNDPNRATGFSVITGDRDDNYGNVGATLQGDFQMGISAFFDYVSLINYERVDDHQFTVGLRVAL